MFPDLARDDVFRLETRRLWLRWPFARDVADISREAGQREIAEGTLEIPHPYPEGAAAEFILKARKANADGDRLTLVLAPKEAPTRVVGAIDLSPSRGNTARLGYWVAKRLWNQGFGGEAARAMIDLAFGLTALEALEAWTRSQNAASIRVLAKSGFSSAGLGRMESLARGGAFEAEHFVLDRRRWSANYGRNTANTQKALRAARS